MNREHVEQTESRANLRTAMALPRMEVSSDTGRHILLALLLLAFPILSQRAIANDVVLAWNANTEAVLAGYRLYYGTASRQYNTSIDVGNVITYKVSDLPAGTYYFAVTAYSGAEETSYSNEVSALITAPDTTPPSISCVAATEVTYSAATISWNTDEPADTQLEYGLSSSYGLVTATDPALATAHVVALTGLAASTTYHYRVKSKDAAGNLSVSADLIFTTSVPIDTKPPVLTSIRSLSVSNNSATIAWTSDEPADTQVEYGPTSAYGSSTTLNPALVTSHSQALTGLASGTVYHYRVLSSDASGNQAVSGGFTFSTTSLPDITSSLVAAYSFDEGTGNKAADSSGVSNFATLNNTSWTSKAKFGKALSFNGKNSYVSAVVESIPAMNSPKTISCWLNVSPGAGSVQSVISLANEAQQASVQQQFRGSQVGMLQYGGMWLVAGNSPPSKTWHHFAYTFDGTQNRFYIDSVLVSSSNLKPQAAPVASFQIGRWITGSDYFKGSIDEVRIYSRALSQEEIAAVMNTPISGTQAAQSLSAAKLEVLADDTESADRRVADLGHNLEPEEASPLKDDSRVAVDIRLSQRSYRPGETVRTSASWLSNPSQRSQSVELKTWLAVPGLATIPVSEAGTVGPTDLPAGLDQEFVPVSLFEISPEMPAGTYQLNARLLDPVTGDILSQDINPFAVVDGKEAARCNLQTLRPNAGVSKLVLESYAGEFVRAGLAELSGLTIANRGDTPVSVELKVWLESAGCRAIPVFRLGEEGSLVLPSGSDLSVDPLALSQALENLPSRSYQLRSRILDPVTGQLLSETDDEVVISLDCEANLLLLVHN